MPARKRSRAARLREHDQADQRDEDQHHDAEAALPRELQDLVLDEPRKPHTVSPPVTSRNTSSSEASEPLDGEDVDPGRRERAQRVGHPLLGDPRVDRALALARPRPVSAGAERREDLRRPPRRAHGQAQPVRRDAVEQLAHGPGRQRAAAVDDRDAVARLLDLREQVARDEDGDAALGGEVAHELADLADAGRVEAVGGLVEDQDVRVAEQRLRDAEALAHAERVGRDLVVQPLGEHDEAARAPRSAPPRPSGSMREKCSRFSRPVRYW